MPRPALPSRNSSKSKRMLIPAIIGLGELGRSDSFTLKAPHSFYKSDSKDLCRSCPDLGVDLSGFSRADTALNMMPDMPSFSISHATAPVGNFLSEMGSNLLASEDVKKEGANLLTHALLDFPTQIARCAATAKAAEVAGRLFVLKQNLGHDIMPDEIAFQVAFLAISCHALWNTVMPKIKAAQVSKFLTPADRKAYQALFKPAGLSWEQYREVSLSSMEWVTLEPGQEASSDESSAYWLYQGSVDLVSDSESSQVTLGLFGEDSIAETLGLKPKAEATKIAAVAGAEGAKVLKMDAGKLKKLFRADQSLASSMTRVLFNTMEEKLAKQHFVVNQAA